MKKCQVKAAGGGAIIISHYLKPLRGSKGDIPFTKGFKRGYPLY